MVGRGHGRSTGGLGARNDSEDGMKDRKRESITVRPRSVNASGSVSSSCCCSDSPAAMSRPCLRDMSVVQPLTPPQGPLFTGAFVPRGHLARLTRKVPDRPSPPEGPKAKFRASVEPSLIVKANKHRIQTGEPLSRSAVVCRSPFDLRLCWCVCRVWDLRRLVSN